MSAWRTVPWFAVALNRFLERNVTKDMDILEMGAGGSTVWLAARAKSIRSYEHDNRWCALVQSKLRDAGLKNCELVYDPNYPELGIKENAREFDIIIIDGRGRVKSMKTTYRLLRPGGYLILDDSQRVRYAEGKAFLDSLDWERIELKLEGIKKSATAWRKSR